MYRPSVVLLSTYKSIRCGALCVDRALSFRVRVIVFIRCGAICIDRALSFRVSIKVLHVMLFRMISLVLIESNHTTKQTMRGWNKRSDSSNTGIM